MDEYKMKRYESELQDACIPPLRQEILYVHGNESFALNIPF